MPRNDRLAKSKWNNFTNMETTTVKMRLDVHARLKMYGSIGETLSDVIEDLLDYYEKHEGKPQKKVKI
jgi:hypothetical protein